MKLAVSAFESKEIPSGFDYFLHPTPMRSNEECLAYESLGFSILEVLDVVGLELIEQARASFKLQKALASLLEKGNKSK